MNKKEFILGMAIISICIAFWTIFGDPVITSTKEVKITQIYTVETKSDEEGNVEVSVK